MQIWEEPNGEGKVHGLPGSYAPEQTVQRRGPRSPLVGSFLRSVMGNALVVVPSRPADSQQFGRNREWDIATKWQSNMGATRVQ